MKTPLRLLVCILAAGALAVMLPSTQAQLKSPQSVSDALRVLNQVVAQTGRLVAAGDYGRIAGELGEFVEGVGLLREALKGEPVEFVARIEMSLSPAIDASAALGKIATTNPDPGKVAAAHADFAAKVQSVVNLFPEELRPDSSQQKPGS